MSSISSSDSNIVLKVDASPAGQPSSGGLPSLTILLSLVMALALSGLWIGFGSPVVQKVRAWHNHLQQGTYRQQCDEGNCDPLMTFCTEQCRAGWGEACDELGHQAERKHPKSYEALEYYERACRAGFLQGCLHSGLMFGHGCKLGKTCPGNVVPLNFGLAAARYTTACQGGLGPAEACANLSYLNLHGYGVDVDHRLAEVLSQKACPGYSLACSNLGWLYDRDRGHGVAVNHAEAERLYRQGCDGGDARGCHNLAEDFREHDGYPLSTRTEEMYGKACTLGFPESCTVLGGELAQHETPDAILGALDKFRRGCTIARQENEPAQCVWLANFYLRHRSVPIQEQLAPILRNVCSAGDGIACLTLGLMYTHGHGVETDLSQAAQSYEDGCQFHEPRACNELGVQFEKGQGVQLNRDRAVKFYEQSCIAHDEDGCQNFHRLQQAL